MATLPVSLYNTLTKSATEFKPKVPGQVGIYCCGPTVYDYQHIGNLRTYIFEDILVRTLRFAGYEVKHVMNITDVGHLVSDADQGEDKMLVAARREKKKSVEIAEYYTSIFFEDCAKLNIRRPDIVCKATEHISEMIQLIQRLEANEFTYISGGNVYFNVEKLQDYGKLARLDLESLRAGARVDVDTNKKNPLDFVLWFTKSKFENQELQWDSPWGRGYPGWHIECSAMSMKYLGDEFDIHCGGIDHIPVHHTNEIAQSEGATLKPWVQVWMHGEFLVLNKEKMSKSKGGFITMSTLVEHNLPPLAYRLFCLGGHYRIQLSFSWEAMEGAKNSFDRLKSLVLTLKDEGGSAKGNAASTYMERFSSAIRDDLNMPRAIALVWEVLGDKVLPPEDRLATLYAMDVVLGFSFDTWVRESFNIPENIQSLMIARDEARNTKQWKEADRLRDEITAQGFLVEDSPTGTKVRPGN